MDSELLPARMVSRVRLYSRPGNDFTRRFPLIVETLARLRSRSCIIDGEAVACDDNGIASFDRKGCMRQTSTRRASCGTLER
jgi:ATP-dependent DNA ligase